MELSEKYIVAIEVTHEARIINYSTIQLSLQIRIGTIEASITTSPQKLKLFGFEVTSVYQANTFGCERTMYIKLILSSHVAPLLHIENWKIGEYYPKFSKRVI